MPRMNIITVIKLLIGVACLQLLLVIIKNSYYIYKHYDSEINEEKLLNIKETSEQVLGLVLDTSIKVLALVPVDLHKYLYMNKSEILTSTNQSRNEMDIRKAIERDNEEQIIYNSDIFGPVRDNTTIIAIQVHKRLTYLRYLIVSLAQARDIEQTLLIFSHDYYDDEINKLVRSIDFTKVMQIFHPYSTQAYPHEFPGEEANDCPDVYVKCRKAKLTGIKHHWWWKANRIFNQLDCTATHTGMVVFLEEDNYVADDFIHMLNILRMTADNECPDCEILVLGQYVKSIQYHNSNLVIVLPWNTHYAMGMSFNKTVWTSIMTFEHEFCAFDDYNWDYSLLHLSQNRIARNHFLAMVCEGSRVFHTGICGFHQTNTNCNASTEINEIQNTLHAVKKYLFPSKLVTMILTQRHLFSWNEKFVTGWGGWDDSRDQELCSNMTKISRPQKSYNDTFMYTEI